jgi:hypothetical protein
MFTSKWSPVRRAIVAWSAAGFAVVVPTTARAQEPVPPRVRISLDVAAQVSTSTVMQTVTFEQYSEQGSLTATYEVPQRPVFGGGLIVRLWRQLGVGVTAEHMSDSGSAQVTASLPNPFEFNQPRTLSGSAPVGRSETAVHLNAAFWAYQSPRIDVLIEGGPSVIHVDQDFVSDIDYSDVPPYTSVTYEGATVVREHQTVVGGNVAGDLTWRLTRHFGVGAVLRFSRAHALFSDSGAPALVVGGFHAGGGLRVSF